MMMMMMMIFTVFLSLPLVIFYLFGLVGRVFTNGLSPRLRHTKDFKNVTRCLFPNTQQHKVRIKGKVELSRERSSAPSTPRCCSYWNGSLLVAFDYGLQLTFKEYYIKMLRAILNKSWRKHPQRISCTSTNNPSRKLSKLDEPDMR